MELKDDHGGDDLGPDGHLDLTLKVDTQELIEAIRTPGIDDPGMCVTPLLIPLLAHFSLFPDTVRAQFSSVRIQVIDIRQSDGVFIRMPQSYWILIDLGTNSQIAFALETEGGIDGVALAIVPHCN